MARTKLSAKKWKELMLTLVNERGGICESCRERIAVDAHHLIYKSQGGSDTADNLIILCRSCHAEAHATKNKSLTKERKNEKRKLGVDATRRALYFGT